MPRIIKTLFSLSLGLGLCLIILNIIGLFLSMRNPAVYSDPKIVLGAELTEKEFYEKLDSISQLPIKEYVKTANEIVNRGMAHYWEDDGIKKYNLRIPAWENYIMYLGSFWRPDFRKYEFCNSKKAIERGVGLCSQLSLVLADILNKHGIKSNLVKLDGHIVVTSLADPDKNEWWVADPDLRAIFEMDLKSLEKDVQLIESTYRKAIEQMQLSDLENRWAKEITNLYTSTENNEVVEGGVAGYLGEGYCRSERYDYLLIWIIPILLMAPGLFLFFWRGIKWKTKKSFLNPD